MAEKDIIVNELKLAYEGLFDATELYNIMDHWFKRYNYEKLETKNIEVVTKQGKHVEVEWTPFKDINNYAENQIKIRMIITEMTEVEIEKEGHKIKMNKGKIHFVFWGFLMTDWENMWENKPLLFFIRSLYNKFFYKGYVNKWKGELKSDVYSLNSAIKSFLNLNRYK